MRDDYQPAAVLKVEIPAGITSPDVLMEALGRSLRFPAYFGRNWNAVFDCLCDFSWLEQPTLIVIDHRDVPALPPPHQEEYLKVLSDAVDSWRVGAEPRTHRLVVHFPNQDSLR